MQQLPSFDTKYIINIIEVMKENGPVDPDKCMCTIDVKAMFPSMPPELVLKGVGNALNRRSCLIRSTDNLISCLEMYPDFNNFIFWEQYFLQIYETMYWTKNGTWLCLLRDGGF